MWQNHKIAIYTIAKNEAKFVERWYESCKEADQVIILDTGSTDDTVAIAQKLGIEVYVEKIDPWRFDDARNLALSFVNDDIDYCIALDMDEVLIRGWKNELLSLNAEVTRPRYKYVWSWNDDGSEGLVYGGDKIHKRWGYTWKHPVHEVLKPVGKPEIQQWINLQIHHHPDNTKSRSQYFGLLELAVKEEPDDPRNTFYLGREYFFYNRYDAGIAELTRYLSLPTATWKPERAAAMRMLAKMDTDNSLYWYVKATKETPDRRESWYHLANYFYTCEYWEGCYDAALKCIDIEHKQLEYLNEADAWSDKPYDLAAISAYYLKKYDKAVEYGKKALQLNPNDERLTNNLFYYERLAK